jgi:hypothetical protein
MLPDDVNRLVNNLLVLLLLKRVAACGVEWYSDFSELLVQLLTTDLLPEVLTLFLHCGFTHWLIDMVYVAFVILN